MRTTLTVFLTGIVLLAGCAAPTQTVRQQRKPVLVDEYSVLDDHKSDKPLSDQMLKRKLEDARRNYLLAMRASEQKNTAVAAKHFEAAMTILNTLVTYPDIYNNPEFTKLSESLVQDYEEQITSIDSLDANSSFFVLRDKIFQEVERIPVERRNYPSKSQINGSATAGGGASTAELEIAMTDNQPVQQCIAFFTSEKGRKFFTRWLERSGKYFPMYERVMQEEGSPMELRYLSMIESGLSAEAVSWAKAVGLWQFIPSTGQMYGLTINWWVDERRDPEKATHAAARYLKDLYNDFGDWHLALAAYNCGPGRVKSAIAKANSRDYWAVRQYLPRETQQYVPLYIAASKIAMDPEAYGFNNINYQTPEDFQKIPVKGPYDLTAIAQAANCSVERIHSLNPELLRDRLPQSDREYELHVPASAPHDLAAVLEEEAAHRPAPTFLTHRVGHGESVKEIAGKYGVTLAAINNANALTPKSKVRAGTLLRIPLAPDSTQSAETLVAVKQNDAEQTDLADISSTPTVPAKRNPDIAMASPAPVVKQEKNANAGGAPAPVTTIKHATSTRTEPVASAARPVSAPKSHKVARGESLTSIAQKYDVAVADLAAWNDMDRNANVQTGQNLSLRESSTKKFREHVSRDEKSRKNNIASADEAKNSKKRSVSTTSTRFETHKVRKGESLTSIADRYGVSVDDLKTWNKDLKHGALNSGASLKIYSETASKGDTKKSSRAAKTSEKKYTVRKGDSMAEIANKFGVSLKQLKKNNPKMTDKSIHSGQTVVIGK
ncbi:MAG: LysM peptidoglycan-binding domain-containing protein [Candidatus Kapaibacterium sp.]